LVSNNPLLGFEHVQLTLVADNGLNVEVGIKVPDITVTAAAGYSKLLSNPDVFEY
jgi:hypothetical protein